MTTYFVFWFDTYDLRTNYSYETFLFRETYSPTYVA